MTEIEIVAIRKDNGNHDNPHEAVSHYKWVQYDSKGRVENSDITPRPKMVGYLKGSLGFQVKAYVERVRPRAYCFVNKSAHGTEFLQTEPDATEQNNLLKLPPC